MRAKVPGRPRREEIASAAIQGSAAAASAVGLAWLVTRAPQNALELGAVVVYGAALVAAFLTSALYHGMRNARIKAVFQKLDQCTIFLLIAGTYTPVALLPLRHREGGMLLGAIWTLAIAGIVLRLMRGRLFQRVSVALYLALGWLCLGWSVPLYHAVGTVPVLLMIAGGLSYTGGLLFFHWHRLPFGHALWHLCVVAGSAWFFVAIAGFATM